MPAPRLLAAALVCATATSAAATITDLTSWDFYRDPDPGPGALQAAMTGSAAVNLAQLNFLSDVDIPAAYDIGYSSVNANTVDSAVAGYYFDASQDFSVSLEFAITLTNPDGVIGLGLGVGEDRAGVNSAGIGFGLVSAFNSTAAAFQGAATNNDVAVRRDLGAVVSPFVSGSTYSGTLTVGYDASTGDISVGASGDGSSSSTSFSRTSDLTSWAGDDLLVSFFLRSDSVSSPIPVGPWSGESAQADFLNFTVVQGSASAVPEPSSIALLGVGGLAMIRRRRS